MCRLVCFLVLTICVLHTEGQSEGDVCTASRSGAPGQCLSILNCVSALRDLRNKINPQLCTFSGTVPIVCCTDTPSAASAATTTPPTPTTTTPPAPTTTTRPASVATTNPPKASTTTEYTPEYGDYEPLGVPAAPDCDPLPPDTAPPRTGQKAWDKCLEYQEQLVFPCEASVTLGGAGGRVRGNHCRHNVKELIINGIDAKEGEFPHMALLGYGEESAIQFQCGGSIISESFVLTAGHCTFAKGLGSVTFALVGALRRAARYGRDQLYAVRAIHKHLGYAPPRRYNDIALLETATRIRLNSFVVPACLDTGAQPVDAAVATGWGALVNGSIADVLQKVKLYQYSDEECVSKIPPNRLLRDGINSTTQACFGDRAQAKDTCQGDSGGPVQVTSAHITCMYVVVGVTSFGRQCGVVGEPGVYSRVRHYLPWIESVVWP